MHALKAVIIFVLVLLADLNFTPQIAHPFNPQQVTRLALSVSLGEGHLDIDRFASKTVDIASFGGHAYADKPPGLSMLALPGVAVARAVLGNVDLLDPQNFIVLLTAAILSTNGLFGALAAAVLYLLALRLGAGERGAVLGAAVLALGTPFFGWSTVFFAHSVSGSLLLIAFALAMWGGNALWRFVAAGFVLGFLLVVDLTAAPAAALVGIAAVLSAPEGRIQRLATLAVGGIVGMLPLFVYNQLAFGSPFHLGYSDVVGFEGMKQGLFGLTVPNPGVLLQILFGLYRGLLPLSPILLLVPVGIVALWRMHRSAAIAIAGTIVCALLINASYFYWDGGSATGPRHLVSMLPLACLALAFVAPRGVMSRSVVGVLAVASFAISAICVSTEMLAGTEFAAPFFDDILPRFLADGPLKAAPVLIGWLGFAALFAWPKRLWPQRHQLAARPLDTAREV